MYMYLQLRDYVSLLYELQRTIICGQKINKVTKNFFPCAKRKLQVHHYSLLYAEMENFSNLTRLYRWTCTQRFTECIQIQKQTHVYSILKDDLFIKQFNLFQKIYSRSALNFVFFVAYLHCLSNFLYLSEIHLKWLIKTKKINENR